MIRSASRVSRFVFAALDAIGRARMARDDRRGRARRLQAACSEIARIHGLALRVRGNLPAGPAVIVANHVGYLDAIALAAVTPCAPLAKRQVSAWPVIGTAAAQLGVIFVDRDDPWSRVRALREMLAALRSGVSIVNFPEGTTTDGSRLLPFARGVFGLAAIAGVPVVPCAIRCDPELAWHGGAAFVPHYLHTTRIASPAIEVAIGTPIHSVPGSADAVRALARHRIAQLLRDRLEPHAVLRFRVPEARPDPVLSPAGRRLAR